MEDKFPARVYADTVLTANFEDAKTFFLSSLLEIHYAHALMLAKQAIITAKETAGILGGLDSLDRTKILQAKYSGAYEDLFFYVEHLLAEACGADLAGKLHTARSRNDIAITLYRMEMRTRVLDTLEYLVELTDVLTRQAEENVQTVMPAHTHTQPAQPTTLAHYLLGAIELLQRDAQRLKAAFATVNRNPLGACAITTTGFAIDRFETTRLLGFEALQENSYGAIAATDYLLEAAGAVSILMINAGKLLHDLLLWCAKEFGYLTLSNAFVQSSSIMPQKRNPVALEHARVLASRAHGEAQAVFASQHNTPFGDIVDSEDDLMPLVFQMFTDAQRTLRLISGAMASASFDTLTLRKAAGENFLTVTELADTLVRSEGMSFRDAHHWTAAAVTANPEDDSHGRIVDDLLRLAPGIRASRSLLLQALDPMRFIQIRTVDGGPSPDRVRENISRSRDVQLSLRQWIGGKRTLLQNYKLLLSTERETLLEAR